MIGAILNDMNEVGYYEQSQKIIKILLTIITAVGTVMLPRLASCFAEKNYKQIKRYMYKTFSFVFALSIPLTFGIIAVANNFAPLFFGNGYEKVPLIMQVLSLIIIFISISNITTNNTDFFNFFFFIFHLLSSCRASNTLFSLFICNYKCI